MGDAAAGAAAADPAIFGRLPIYPTTTTTSTPSTIIDTDSNSPRAWKHPARFGSPLPMTREGIRRVFEVLCAVSCGGLCGDLCVYTTPAHISVIVLSGPVGTARQVSGGPCNVFVSVTKALSARLQRVRLGSGHPQLNQSTSLTIYDCQQHSDS